MNNRLPHLDYETELWNKNYLVIGIDEVGRGALAGPVGVGAVCFDSRHAKKLLKLGINDSKKLTASARNSISTQMKDFVLASSIQFSSVSLIDKMGIVNAVNSAIRKSVNEIQEQLETSVPIYLLLDAFTVKNIPKIGIKNQTAIIKGDQISISIAAASIVAKIQRDLVMTELSSSFTSYKWHENKGYGTAVHLQAIRENGLTLWHRKLFVRNVISAGHFQSTSVNRSVNQV